MRAYKVVVGQPLSDARLRQCLFQSLDAELCAHAVGPPSDQDLAAVPIHVRCEIQEAKPHRAFCN